MNSMLAVQNTNQPRFVSRIFTDTSGRQFRLTFVVTLVDGELKGRLISATLIADSQPRLTGSVCTGPHASFLLPCDNKVTFECIAGGYTTTPSPYFSLEYLINSQPTRAPSRA